MSMLNSDQAITVGELIVLLQALDPTLPCCYSCCSDWVELAAEDVKVKALQARRGDGYVGDARPDKPLQPWLTFPGN